MGRRSLRTIAALLYGVVAPLVAAATGITLEQTMAAVTLPVIALVLTLSSILGLASLLNVLKDVTPPRFGWFVAAHMFSAWTGGIFAFIVAEWYNWNDWAEVAFICACSYGGARSLDTMRDRVLDILPRIFRG